MGEETLPGRVKDAVGNHVPGVSVVIVGPDGVRARAGVGLANLKTGMAISPDLAAPWFSMTKIATATATMALAERGVLDLDVPVASMVPVVR